MNKFYNKFLLLALVLGATTVQLKAQFTTTFAKNVNPGQNSGFYYSLPQTMLRLDFVIEETTCEQGPLAGYASNYFGGDEYVELGRKGYKIVDVTMAEEATPDPNATFFVNVGSGRGAGKVEFDILPNGVIRSVGVGAAMTEASEIVEYQEKSKPSPNVSENSRNRGFIVLSTSGKSDAQLAREAADQIAEIRKAKYYLISGDVEMASNPETFKAMYEKLDEMEQEYLSLFMGKRITKTVVKSVYVVPSKEVPTQTVAKFSEAEGLTMGTSGSGSPIMVQTLPLNGTTSINAPSQTAVESLSYENKLFYRVPETANVKVTFKNNTLLEERLVINQLGVLLMAPVSNARLVFDTTTGQIVSMKMQ